MNKSFNISLKFGHRRGGALGFTLIILVVISILSMSVLYIFNTNLKQATHQKDQLTAYYLAYSGAEMAYEALLSDERNKLNELTRENSPKLKHEELAYKFGDGTINIEAKMAEEETLDGWVKITSTGILDKNGYTYTRYFYFHAIDVYKNFWDD